MWFDRGTDWLFLFLSFFFFFLPLLWFQFGLASLRYCEILNSTNDNKIVGDDLWIAERFSLVLVPTRWVGKSVLSTIC